MATNTTYLELLENLFDGVYYVDNQRKITFWNAAAERITGFKKNEVLGKACADNILRHIDAAGCEMCIDGCPLHETLQDGEMREASLFLHHKLGHRVPVHIRIAPIKDEAGEVIGGVEVFSDNSKILEVLQQLEEVKKKNFIDPLLQIGNRRYANMIFETRLYELKAFDVSFSFILIDLDNFKQINDSFGHNTGDQVLQMIARSIQNISRGLDSIIRWGGDEIVLFLPNVTGKGLEDIAERIGIFVEKSFMMIDEEKISVTASLGVTLAKPEDTLESIIERADKLMYISKNKGGNNYTIG